MGPVSSIWEELDKAHEGHTSAMKIEDVVKLLEKTTRSHDWPGERSVPLLVENTFPRQDS